MFTRFYAILVASFFACTANAAELGATTFNDQFVYASSAPVAAGYFTIISPKDDKIIRLYSDCCKAVEMHRNEKINGKMTMRRIGEMPVEKEEPKRILPDSKGGEHMMLIGLKEALKPGDVVKVTFTFEKAGEQTVSFPVKERTASEPEFGHSHHE